jgi:anti-sigma-K factor RskA
VFIAEKIGERKKGEVADPLERAIGWTVAQWLDRLAPFADLYPAIETVFSSRERIGTATITTRHTRRDGCWHSEVAGPR